MALHLASLWNRGLVRLGGGPNLFICVLVMVLNCVFQQEQFNRFLWFLASVIKNGGTLTTCYFHFLVQKVSIISKSSDRFFPNFNNIFLKSLTNSRGSRVQSRGRGSKVTVAGLMSRSRVQCRGRGKWFGVRGNSWVKTTDMNTK